ncbi:class I adenylate-forming enzyme family protein [Ancylobacter mangrovi]|uniref:class I adenylate-forming enzyme family protein n=1 Tax=Ancylobacter mangrovi TaxID=2972472 RepID=UPI002163222E|nr:AMP-binding protein [Ancylobacter mangrovi]MCS0500930.1 AMP-binding protein [Ancylobacter mangrovi]
MAAATIAQTLPALAAADPHAPALLCDDERRSRAELAARVGGLAAWLTGRTPPGAGIALALDNGPALVELFLACAVSGRQALVYDPAWPPSGRAAIEAALAPELTLEAAPDVPAAPFPPPPTPLAPFYVGFTSGTTGTPKGYRRNHRSWIDSFAVSEAEFGLGPDDVVLAPGGLAASLHLYGVVHALHAGAPAVMSRQFNPERLFALIARHGVTALYATPTQLQMLVRMAEGARFERVRALMISGAKWHEAMRAGTRALFPNARIFEFYGASEMSFVTIGHPDEPVPEGSVGRAAGGVEIRIRDGEGRDLPAGETGTIWVASPMLFDAYASGGGTETRRAGAFLTVGDRGWLDAQGYLFLAGREKRMLVTAGQNVYPEEIEAALMALEGIEEAAVFGLSDPLRGVRLVAVLRRRDGAARADEPALRAALKSRLAAYKIPRRFLVVARWPRTSGGKADLPALQRLAERLLAEERDAAGPAA